MAAEPFDSDERARTAAPTRSLKRVFVLALGVASGVTVAVGLLGILGIWYMSRPKPPKPWNKQAIVATYDRVSTEGEDNHFVLSYVLENRTPSDYRLDEHSSHSVAALLARQKSLSRDDDQISIDLPLFIPAGHRQRVRLHLKYPFGEPYPAASDREAQKQHVARLEKHMRDEFTNLAGFVVFDDANRYEITLPRGW